MKKRSLGYTGTNARAALIQEEMLKHKVQRRHDYWLYSGIATVSGFIGLWIGVALTNGTW